MTTVAKPSTAPLFPTKSVSDFAFADFLATEYQFGLDPNRPWCKDFKEGQCDKGNACPEKHNTTPSKNNLVCKHWLRGLCKMSDQCVYLHEFNLRRMPECTHYSRTLSCPNGEECLYQHVDPVTKLTPCPNYEQGFCPLGSRCSKKHIRREMCRYWLAGFCPNGRQCKEGEHPKYRDDLPKPTPRVYRSEQELEAERQQIRETAEKQEDRGWGSRGLPRGDLRRNRGRGGGGFGQNTDGPRFQNRR